MPTPRLPRSLLTWLALISLLGVPSQAWSKDKKASIYRHLIKPAIEVIGVALDVYEVSKSDELSDRARAQIERSLKRQLDEGLQPLHVIDTRTREILGAQGRIELGIDQLSAHLDQWGDQLLSGQGKLSEKLDELARENQKNHAFTQALLKHMMKADLHSGLRDLNDAIAMFKQNPEDQIARQMLATAKSTLVKHIEFLREEEASGRPTPIEHWALLRLSLVSCYLGLGLSDAALTEAEELMALPVESAGLIRLAGELPSQIKESKLKFYDERSQSVDRRVKGLIYVKGRLKKWSEALADERSRLTRMKLKVIERLSASDELKSKWEARTHNAKVRAERREDELALKAFMMLSSEYASKLRPPSPCSSSAVGCPALKWIMINGGTFAMGSNDGADDEKPIHTVQVSSFIMAESEVTVAQYRKCVEAGVCTEPHWDDSTCYVLNGSSWSKGVLPKSLRSDELPVTCVDWGQARTFSRWVGGDLPTEAQWEYAARGGEGFKYAGSDDPDEVAWYSENTNNTGTREVKMKKRNGYGLYDMSGNVWEWTLDEWHGSYSGAPSSGDQPWGHVPRCGQKCDSWSSRRVSRGGGWDYDARTLRVAYRSSGGPDARNYRIGFRPAGPIP